MRWREWLVGWAAAVVAVGGAGLAQPRDEVAFAAGDDTTLETAGWTLTTALPLRIEGPGSLVLEGDLVVRTREGERRAARLALADGPYVVEVGADGSLTATVRGDLDVT